MVGEWVVGWVVVVVTMCAVAGGAALGGAAYEYPPG